MPTCSGRRRSTYNGAFLCEVLASEVEVEGGGGGVEEGGRVGDDRVAGHALLAHLNQTQYQ